MALRNTFLLLAVCAPGIALAGQAVPVASAAPTSAPPVQATPASTTLRPALDVVQTAIAALKVDRWKASNAIRDEAQSNLGSVQRDLQTTLPALLATADASPNSASKVLPVYRNVEALYDVMLRLDAAARLAAPSDQMSALDQAVAKLDEGRRALGDQLQSNAEAQEARTVRLEAALKAVPPPQPPPPAPAPVKCPVAPTRKKTTTAAKPKTPPATTQATPPSH